MRKSILLLIMATAGLCSWGQSSQSTTDSAYIGTSDSAKNDQDQKPLSNQNKNFINTKYEYTESNGARMIIQNSFPRSKINYTDRNGKKYTYAVFWTRIINETANPLELTIDFPLDSFEFPSSSGNYMKLLHSGTMTIDQETFKDDSTLISFLDNNRYQMSSLERTMHPKGSTTFYVITLTDRALGAIRAAGMLRTGLSKKGQDLFYTISNYTPTQAPSLLNDKEIHCGSINLKN